ncbi:CHASE domain-containing protein [Adhaeribacter radiodurans]|uniref:histidine kinase n=1 Tax=Adhaeribacter radiodurans TaxID=2745197 RepID=A0A7L7L890_9BACT|nr:CHASE domain-containing protein [Adhaeribacter radiodurans]QMU29030.1 CHASE domain-containing protein [Adhaeribacter radiodurans]
MINYFQVLKGGKALFAASGKVTHLEWEKYIGALEVSKNYPGIQGIGFAPIVRANELTKHIQEIRSTGFPEYTVNPAGTRLFYTPIIFIEPFTGRNLRAFGYDMFNEPIRRQAMEKARDSGQPTLTRKVRLVQETGKDLQPGFLLYLPVYGHFNTPATKAERRQLLSGFVYSPFRAEDFMVKVFNQNFENLHIQIYDGTTIQPENLLYESDSFKQKENIPTRFPVFTRMLPLQIGDRTWTLRFTQQIAVPSSGANLPNLILAGGGIISFLVFLAMYLVANTRRFNRLKQTITDNATAALFMMDAKGYCTFMNPAAEAMVGFTLEEIQQKPLHEMIHHTRPDGSHFPLQECPIDRALPTNNSMRAHEDVFIRKDGTFFPVSCAASPIYEHGIPVSTVIEVRDITEEQKARTALEESEDRFRNMADSAPVLIWMNNTDNKITYVNKQWLEFAGQTLEEALNNGWDKVVHPDDREKIKAIYVNARKSLVSYAVDYRIKRHTGTYRWVASKATPRFDAKGQFLGYIGSISDITERKEAEKRLKENADLLNQIFLEVPAIVSLIRATDHVYLLANPMFSMLHGNRPLLGRNIREANPDLEKLGFVEHINRVVATGKPFVGNEVLITFENEGESRMGYFNLVLQPLTTGRNQVAVILLFAVEVTELVESRKKLLSTNEELQNTNVELRRINNDLDNFVYTASHDLKAPIANLEGLTTDLKYTLRNQLGGDEQLLLSLISDSILKLKRTIVDLTEITKAQKEASAPKEFLYFKEILDDVLSDLQPMINQTGTQLHINLEAEKVYYARKNLRSILYNLISNAIKYRIPEKTPDITLSTTHTGNLIKLMVKDNGLGIRSDQQSKLFGMFKRVHTHVEGSGIGLYMMKRIVENNGGRIELESEAGQGSTFYVYFQKERNVVKN